MIEYVRQRFEWLTGETGRPWYTAVLIALVGFLSFGLGRLTVLERATPVTIDYFQTQTAAVNAAFATATPAASSATPVQSGAVVASKSGTKYHFPWCSGAKSISEANKIYFASIDEARAAGYLPAANCKGLK